MEKNSDSATGANRRRAARAAARTRARLMAVQALYQMDIAQTDLNDVLVTYRQVLLDEDGGPIAGSVDEQSQSERAEPDRALFEDITRGVLAAQRTIDPVIQQFLAEGWRLGRIDATMRAILRAGAYELTGRPDIPFRVVISEYVDIAHAFFESDEPRVVNAVLDRLAKNPPTSTPENAPTDTAEAEQSQGEENAVLTEPAPDATAPNQPADATDPSASTGAPATTPKEPHPPVSDAGASDG